MKPIIGIVESPYLDKDEDLVYEIRTPLIEWIIRSSGRPIGLFPSQIEDFYNKRLRNISDMNQEQKQDLKETLNICSAIIKPGAVKIYNHERFIYNYCLEKNMPYLGICAGMQIMAHYGKEQILNERNNSHINHHSDELYSHMVYLEKNSNLKTMLQENEIPVNSLHNYHIKDSGINRIAAYSSDNIIEAIENPNMDYHLGLQWHPELLPKEDKNSQIIFGEFIEAAKTYQKRRVNR